jgi:phosphate:Na+ symporter
MSDIVLSMLKDAAIVLKKNDVELVASIRKRDDQMDVLNRELNLYLAQNLEQAPKMIQLDMIRLMNFAADLEASADVVDNQILELSAKTQTLKVFFPDEGLRDLNEMHAAVVKVAEMAICCFQTRDKKLAAQVIAEKRNIRKMEHRMREAHIARMVKGSLDSINTSSIHLDVLGEYRRFVGLISNHTYSIVKNPYSLSRQKPPPNEPVN